MQDVEPEAQEKRCGGGQDQAPHCQQPQALLVFRRAAPSDQPTYVRTYVHKSQTKTEASITLGHTKTP